MDILTFHLIPSGAAVDFLVEGQARQRALSYVQAPEFRAVVNVVVQELVETQQRGLFGQACGRCGNSCRRPNILVREQEILALQAHLSLDEPSFRDRHLEPAGTWNAGDAILRHSNGACPFLSSDGTDRPLNAVCTVHEIRPQSCREFQSNASICRKDLRVTLQELSRLTITRTHMLAESIDGSRAQLPTAPQRWDELCAAFAATEMSDPERFERTTEQINDLLDRLLGEFSRATLDDFYMNVIAGVEKLIHTAASMVDMRPHVGSRVELMWGRYRQLQQLIDRREAGESSPSPAVPRPTGLEWLILGESALALKLAERPEPIQLTLEPVLVEARTLLRSILERPEDDLQHYLRRAEPECLVCGECCRAYQVEIMPSDVHRLCFVLKLSYADFLEHYSQPGRFSWNPHDRILNKQTVPRYSKGLRELRVIGSQTEEMCQFLERRDTGLYVCKVYSHRPHPCRTYEPTNVLCRKTNQRENWGRQAQNLRSVLITSEAFFLQGTDRPEALRYPRQHWPEVDDAARGLETAAVSGL